MDYLEGNTALAMGVLTLIDLVKLKDQLVNSEKTKILNMHSKSHYNNLQRTIAVKFFNE